MMDQRASTDPIGNDGEARFQSIASLGRLLAWVDTEDARHDEATMEHAEWTLDRRRHEAARAAMLVRGNALRELILSLPAENLSDAATQIGAAISVAEGIVIHQLTPQEASERGAKLLRVLLSVLPQVTAAAGMPAADLSWTAADLLRRVHASDMLSAA